MTDEPRRRRRGWLVVHELANKTRYRSLPLFPGGNRWTDDTRFAEVFFERRWASRTLHYLRTSGARDCRVVPVWL